MNCAGGEATARLSGEAKPNFAAPRLLCGEPSGRCEAQRPLAVLLQQLPSEAERERAPESGEPVVEALGESCNLGREGEGLSDKLERLPCETGRPVGSGSGDGDRSGHRTAPSPETASELLSTEDAEEMQGTPPSFGNVATTASTNRSRAGLSPTDRERRG